MLVVAQIHGDLLNKVTSFKQKEEVKSCRKFLLETMHVIVQICLMNINSSFIITCKAKRNLNILLLSPQSTCSQSTEIHWSKNYFCRKEKMIFRFSLINGRVLCHQKELFERELFKTWDNDVSYKAKEIKVISQSELRIENEDSVK